MSTTERTFEFRPTEELNPLPEGEEIRFTVSEFKEMHQAFLAQMKAENPAYIPPPHIPPIEICFYSNDGQTKVCLYRPA